MADKKISALDDGTAAVATDKIPIERSGANYYLEAVDLWKIADASNLVFGTSTGSKIGTATTQKIGFYNATPVVQQTHVADAATNLSTSYTTGNLDTEAEIISAINTTNTRINAIATTLNSVIAKLETLGLLASS